MVAALVVTAAAATALALGLGDEGAPIDSIAVLPFENLGSSPDGAYLSEGLTAGLTDRLARIDRLRVVPRGVAAAYGASALQEAGEALAVRALVTGSVGEVGGRLVVRAELTDVAALDQIWGARFDRPLTDILAVQDSLLRDIVDQLRLELDPEERLELASRHDEAIRVLEAAMAARGEDRGADASMALLLARQGRRDDAMEILEDVLDGSGSVVAAAAAWTVLGEPDRAFALLDTAWTRRDQGLWWIKAEPAFAPLRGDPRYAALLERMNLPRD